MENKLIVKVTGRQTNHRKDKWWADRLTIQGRDKAGWQVDIVRWENRDTGKGKKQTATRQGAFVIQTGWPIKRRTGSGSGRERQHDAGKDRVTGRAGD